jgi:hypothetical protein
MWVILMAVVFAFVVLTALTVAQRIEQLYFPVNVDWTPSSVTREGDNLIVAGTMVHARDCQYIPPPRARTIDGQGLLVESRSPTRATSWAVSDTPQRFGPWVVHGGAGKRVLFYQEHRCHLLWHITTDLGEVDDR